MTKKNNVILGKLSRDRIDNSKIIALMNNKGGCGKTSTSIALGMYLVRTGHNVLFWDNDPQSNLTQRMGLSDNKCPDKRINILFASAHMAGFERDHRKLISVVEYPFIYRMNKSIARPGKIGLMAGSHDAEIEANSADKKMGQKTFSEVEHKDIYKFFNSTVQFYRNYFDYIIMDTAPAIEGNILNKLASRAVNEIIIPVDGIEAAFGMRTLLSWIVSQTRDFNGGSPPNITFAMVKYQEDSKRLGLDTSTLRLRNSVYRAMKDAFGDYVCDQGVRETQTLRSVVSGFKGSKKTDYYALTQEISEKLELPRENIFKKINSNTFNGLESQLLILQSKIQEKTPKFKSPYYTALTEQTELNEP